MSQAKQIAAYLKDDRQWKRKHRLSFAERMLKFAKADGYSGEHDAEFWQAIVKANTQ
jgi:hypothetical protein